MPSSRSIHGVAVHARRVEVLATHLTSMLEGDATVLDLGCGDGLLAHRLKTKQPGISIEGLDVQARAHAHIPVQEFDGTHIPLEDDSVDVVSIVDVLHHTDDPAVLLREAKRVARRAIILKDHTEEGFLAHGTLRFMDWVGNARHGVALPYNYWTRRQWHDAFNELGLEPVRWVDRLGLYPAPANWIFGRLLHFVARLEWSDHA